MVWVVCVFFMLAALILLGPWDIFTHGYYCEEIAVWQIPPEDFQDSIRLENSSYEMTFSPQKAHLAGFEIRLDNQQDNSGKLLLEILDGEGNVVDTIYADLGKINSGSWYKLYTAAKLKQGEVYTLRFSADGYAAAPCLQAADSVYLPDETITGNVLLSYAYARPTFTRQNRILIFLFIIAALGYIVTFYINGSCKVIIKRIAAAIFMVSLLAWNYMYNSMDNQNTDFERFQEDSETLVAGMVYADQNDIYFLDEYERGYGLGKYYDLKGEMVSYGGLYISDDNWLDGYSRTEAAIIADANVYSRSVIAAGNYISFGNGEVFMITGIDDSGDRIVAYLNTDKPLTLAKYGSLDEAVFCGPDHQQLAPCRIKAYESQYGLQGKIFKHLARHMDDGQSIDNLHLLCAMLTATVFVLIVYLVAVRYNTILAGCFFVTFWLSPWIVNFARNLYWVEFTWFIPMAVGLFCAWRVDDKKCRIVSYCLTFIAVLVKCMCGYEYISVIMMGVIAFLLVDFIQAFVKKDKEKGKLLFRTIVIIGCTALAGFVAAIGIHASLRGQGSILEGIKIIFEQDVLRRTNGADLNEFPPRYWDSFNSSVWEVYCKYFHFSTEIITGIAGNLFPVLCVAPLFIFGCEYKNKRLNVELLGMYGVFFLTSISWFCLAKAHSYVHTHMNYVLWYFGYVQICIYILINKIVEVYRNIVKGTRGM